LLFTNSPIIRVELPQRKTGLKAAISEITFSLDQVRRLHFQASQLRPRPQESLISTSQHVVASMKSNYGLSMRSKHGGTCTDVALLLERDTYMGTSQQTHSLLSNMTAMHCLFSTRCVLIKGMWVRQKASIPGGGSMLAYKRAPSP
jgi:hypothetical protein